MIINSLYDAHLMNQASIKTAFNISIAVSGADICSISYGTTSPSGKVVSFCSLSIPPPSIPVR